MPPTVPLPPRMLLGFIVRRCAAALGHDPSPEEFADWANNYCRQDGRVVSLFGRRISVSEARLILRNPARPVTARLGTAGGPPDGAGAAAAPVVLLADARRRPRPRPPTK